MLDGPRNGLCMSTTVTMVVMMAALASMRGAMLICGTTSDAGKSVLVAGLCRFLARQGVDVVPFKAQNMSNNSFVTLDGGEIGRAQALQARAAFKEPSVRFNPVLLKPGSDRTSQVVVLGKAVGEVSALSYRDRKQQTKLGNSLHVMHSSLPGVFRRRGSPSAFSAPSSSSWPSSFTWVV